MALITLPSPVTHAVYRGGTVTLPPGRAYAYFLAGNGVFKLAESRHLVALIPLSSARVAGLPDLVPYARLKAGKLPGSLLAAMLNDARRQAWDAPREAMYHIRIESRESRIRAVIERPEQQGTAAHLAYNGGGDADIVLDLHSHCEMRAFFSATDNRDEQGFRLYAVIGRVFSRPEIALRVGVYGDFWRVPVGKVFTDAAAAGGG